MKSPIIHQQPSEAIPAELFENLHRQIDLSQQLLDILEQELAILTSMDIQTLISLTRKKENHLKRLHLLDASFQEIAGAICATSGSEPVRLQQIIDLAGVEEARRLEQSRVRLVALRHKIHDRNLINKQLAHDILGYLNDAVSLITNAVAGQAPYTASGETRSSLRQPALISREI